MTSWIWKGAPIFPPRLAGVPYDSAGRDPQLRLAGHPGEESAGPPRCGAGHGPQPGEHSHPCHRVIATDGSLRGYGGGLELKQRLLDLERAVRL